MLKRAVVVAAFALALSRCANQAPRDAPDAAPPDTSPPRCGVRFDPGGAVRVRSSEEVTLRVVLAPPESGAEVRFGLLGDARDASLSGMRGESDGAGVATVHLVAPSGPGSFRVRASRACGAEAQVTVDVSDRGFGGLDVVAAYRGARQPTGLVVNLYRAPGCDALVGLEPDRSARLPPAGGRVEFRGLPAGVEHVVRAVVEGNRALVLASGCAGTWRVESDRSAEATLLFNDNPLRLGAVYDLSLAFDLGAVAARAAARWRAPVEAELASAGGEGLFLGVELAPAVGAAAPPGLGPAAQVAFERAVRERLAMEVSMALVRSDRLLGTLFGRLAEATAASLGSVRAHGTLEVTTRDGDVEAPLHALTYTLDPGTPEVRGDDVLTVAEGTGVVSFTRAAGDGVDVRLAAAPAPFTALSLSALAATLARLRVTQASEYVALAVCPLVAPILRPAAGACDEACLQAACRVSVQRLGRAFEAAVAASEPRRAAVDLRFSAPAHAPPGELLIDRLAGPAVGAFRDSPDPPVAAVAEVTLQTPVEP
ncbi:MAG: hypothetical protein HY909_24635 [Deltaproteobacteria bacterium]|nr:hypothetical protein [Deltaproteobacteria bacterium]